MAITSYINLARKYRPQSVKDLIGQEALVTTLQNAFSLNRIAHAFMLTGVRGVGKTTTARIIAKALNCIGKDGKGDITLNPCGVCENCVSITEDRHMDIIEMDAASRTGVDDVRGIIENAKYNPVSARYKVFIIDEVHMLSKNAFNALLKTLEEPPPRLKFIFATTEIRKVPITVLSRCQRFDLQRITIDVLANNLANICKQENINYNDAGLFLLAKAANGSARDSLSLLDQAIVYADVINAENVANMLGQGSIEEIYNLFAAILQNKENNSFKLLEQQYNKGIELPLLFEDLLEICHNVTMCKVLGKAPVSLSEFEAESSTNIANQTSLPVLIKTWQVLLKGLEELQKAIIPINTARMVMAKLSLVNSLGDVDKIINFINQNPELQNNPTTVTMPDDSSVTPKRSSTIPNESTGSSAVASNTRNSNYNSSNVATKESNAVTSGSSASDNLIEVKDSKSGHSAGGTTVSRTTNSAKMPTHQASLSTVEKPSGANTLSSYQDKHFYDKPNNVDDANTANNNSNNHTNHTNTKTLTSSTDTNNLSARDEIFLKKEYDTPITTVKPTATPPIVETNNNLASSNLTEEVAKVGASPMATQGTINNNPTTTLVNPEPNQMEVTSSVNSNFTATVVTRETPPEEVARELTSTTNSTVTAREVKVGIKQELSPSSHSQPMSETEITKTVTSIFSNAKKVD
ncbi:DNA polymerase III, gamma/tau subunit [Candidatus Hepatincola sp. Pdp]